MAGNGDRLKPLLRPAPARAAAGGGAAGFPGAEAPGYRNPNSRSNYLVDDHKRRAIETRTPDQIIWLMTISAGLSKPELPIKLFG